MAGKPRQWIGLATLTWRFEAEATDSESHTIAQEQFEREIAKVLEEHLDPTLLAKYTVKCKANRCAERVSKKARVGGPYNPDDILQHRRFAEPPDHKDVLMDFSGDDGTVWKVSMVSQRYHVFARDNCTCQACGLKGTVMYLERDRSTKEGRAHFNLYAIENGKEVLFTKDHILASSNGGPGTLENLQTYCSVCNLLKGRAFITNEQVAELRKVYNEKLIKHPNAVVRDIKAKKQGIGAEPSYGKKKMKLHQAALAKQKALEPRLKLNISIAVLPMPNNEKHCGGVPWAELRPKTRAKAKVVLPVGTVLQVNRSSAGMVICFLDEEGTKISIPHRYLEAVDGSEEGKQGPGPQEVAGEVQVEGSIGVGELQRPAEGDGNPPGTDA